VDVERWATAALPEGDVFVSTRAREEGGRAAKGTLGAPFCLLFMQVHLLLLHAYTQFQGVRVISACCICSAPTCGISCGKAESLLFFVLVELSYRARRHLR
jgi:hypothetical protein